MLLFISIIGEHAVCCYADDTQLYFCSAAEAADYLGGFCEGPDDLSLSTLAFWENGALRFTLQ